MLECYDDEINSLPSELAEEILGWRLAVMFCLDARLVAYLVAVLARGDILGVKLEYRLFVQANLALFPAVFTFLLNGQRIDENEGQDKLTLHSRRCVLRRCHNFLICFSRRAGLPMSS